MEVYKLSLILFSTLSNNIFQGLSIPTFLRRRRVAIAYVTIGDDLKRNLGYSHWWGNNTPFVATAIVLRNNCYQTSLVFGASNNKLSC